ncbi:hypothetical protein PPERSA_01838 [Pseudocohnilembus persalinus]|uniref:Uncharacterized protein n=1 Tax=Pseudocohnilembus persalinus TaxID=266149 RepID=A0A0V0QKK1_PSEPJ|nr:hypothetical protein PPERSA_01838 [Pseudocohnilembus persalinus]|eukprot:KRX02721.1 hypothetical protein PPERSA_01838 [Pseudocohnilembus persalinus]
MSNIILQYIKLNTYPNEQPMQLVKIHIFNQNFRLQYLYHRSKLSTFHLYHFPKLILIIFNINLNFQNNFYIYNIQISNIYYQKSQPQHICNLYYIIQYNILLNQLQKIII